MAAVALLHGPLARAGFRKAQNGAAAEVCRFAEDGVDAADSRKNRHVTSSGRLRVTHNTHEHSLVGSRGSCRVAAAHTRHYCCVDAVSTDAASAVAAYFFSQPIFNEGQDEKGEHNAISLLVPRYFCIRRLQENRCSSEVSMSASLSRCWRRTQQKIRTLGGSKLSVGGSAAGSTTGVRGTFS